SSSSTRAKGTCPSNGLTRAMPSCGRKPGSIGTSGPRDRRRSIVQDEPQAALITGLFGTGKSSVAIEMADVLEQPGLPYAVIDLDWLCWGGGGGAEGSEHRMMLANLAPVMTNYLGAATSSSLARSRTT